MGGHAFFPPDPRTAGHTRDQHPHVVRPETAKRGPPVFLALATPFRVRGHVHHVQRTLRRGTLNAGAGVRAVLANRGWQNQLDRQVQPGNRGRHDGGAGAFVPPGNRPRVPRRCGGHFAEARRGQNTAVRVRGDSRTEQVPPVAKHAHLQLHLSGGLDEPEVLRLDGGRGAGGQARGGGGDGQGGVRREHQGFEENHARRY
mmetsp:Transcript_7633/g.28584  ORF Transcript_7633/g.28584 Transcript_7633/m.28584 type:complete len:201 (-) Transcript_7633:266-868(-)